MVLRNYEDRLDFLNRNIDEINKAVSDLLGFDVNFEVETFQYGADNIIRLRDDTNIRYKCGVLSTCFESVYLSNGGVCWDDNSVWITINCSCLSISGNEYVATICRVRIVGDEVSVRLVG